MSEGELPEVELERLSQRLRVLARRLSSDDSTAEDLAQEALVAALEQPAGKIADLEVWSARVVRHLAYRQYRRNALRKEAERVSREWSGLSDDEVRDQSVALLELSREIQALAEPYGSVLDLRYFEGLSNEAIATRLGRKPETIKKQLHRGLAQVRERMERAGRGRALDWSFLLLPLEFSSVPAGIDALDSELELDSKGSGGGSWSATRFVLVGSFISAVAVGVVMSSLGGDDGVERSGLSTVASEVAPTRDPESALPASDSLAQASPSASRAPVPVAARAETEALVLEPEHYELRARAVDKSGEPVAGVEFTWLDSDYTVLGTSAGGGEGAAQFRLPVDTPGLLSAYRGDRRALVHASAPGYATSFTCEFPLPCTQEIVVELAGEAAFLWGVFVDTAGEPLAGVLVQAFAGAESLVKDDAGFYRGPLIHETTTDADGFFEVLALQRTNTYVHGFLKGYVEGAWNEAMGTEPEAEREYVLVRGATIEGTVHDVNGGALEGVHVAVSTSPGQKGASTFTDARGRFELEGVRSGKRWLSADHPDRPLFGDQVAIDLGPDESLEWNARLQPLDFVDIRVSSESGASVEDLVLVAQASNWHGVPRLQANGTYRLTFLPPGPNVLSVTTHQQIQMRAEPTLRRDVQLTNQELLVELRDPSWGGLELQLVSAEGAPLPPTRLRLRQTEGSAHSETSLDPSSGRASCRMQPGPCRVSVLCSWGVWELGEFEVEPGVTRDLGAMISPALRPIPVPATSSVTDGPWLLEVSAQAKSEKGFHAPLASFDALPRELSLWPGDYELTSVEVRIPIRVPR